MSTHLQRALREWQPDEAHLHLLTVLSPQERWEVQEHYLEQFRFIPDDDTRTHVPRGNGTDNDNSTTTTRPLHNKRQ
jgi:hypothetical protein